LRNGINRNTAKRLISKDTRLILFIGCLEYYRQASRQSSQSEPVAWRYRYHNEGSWQVSLNQTCEADLEWLKETYKELLIEPLYLAAPQQAIPSGWKLVPIEPNGDMLCAGRELDVWNINPMPMKVYKAMLSASPTAPIESDK
jgi:hypothetical protein